MNELELSDYNFKKIFKEALGFRGTFEILETTVNISNIADIDYLTPMITSIIFSCELYLKILVIYYKIDFKKEHSLKKLFNLLPTEIKDNIENAFNTSCSNNEYFKKALEASSNSYTKLRYHFSYDENITIESIEKVV